FEVLSAGSKKVLGIFGGSPAKVRAYYEIPEHAAKKEAVKKETKPAKRENSPSKPASAKPPRQENSVDVSDGAVRDGVKASEDNTAVRYLKDIISNMGIEADIEAFENNGELYININGNGVGAVIGHHGETLDALQYLVSLAVNRNGKVYSRVTLDSGDYRKKRADSLRTLASNVASQSIRTHRNIALEPMNPYERRIIHTEVQEIEGVTSWSTGDEPNRRVVIGNEGFESAGSYGRRNDRRGNRNRRQGSNRRPAREVYKPDESSLREKKVEHEDVALYGKIN
ncbi:MAG: RNA-binding cell elongation regulator Jag/EloR, partial [Acutalibacteraceae bacterium]